MSDAQAPDSSDSFVGDVVPVRRSVMAGRTVWRSWPVVCTGANSSTAPQPVATNAGSNIAVVKLN